MPNRPQYCYPDEFDLLSIKTILREVKLRPSRQRLALIHLLLSMPNELVSIDAVYQESLRRRRPIPRSTITAVLRRFSESGLMKRVSKDSSRKAWFSIASQIASSAVPISGRDLV